jgi:transcription initiation factor TFIID subunit 6
MALGVKNCEKIYGYSMDPGAFKIANGINGDKIHYLDDQEIDLEELIHRPLPAVPHDVSFTGKLCNLYNKLSQLKRFQNSRN